MIKTGVRSVAACAQAIAALGGSIAGRVCGAASAPAPWTSLTGMIATGV